MTESKLWKSMHFKSSGRPTHFQIGKMRASCLSWPDYWPERQCPVRPWGTFPGPNRLASSAFTAIRCVSSRERGLCSGREQPVSFRKRVNHTRISNTETNIDCNIWVFIIRWLIRSHMYPNRQQLSGTLKAFTSTKVRVDNTHTLSFVYSLHKCFKQLTLPGSSAGC